MSFPGRSLVRDKNAMQKAVRHPVEAGVSVRSSEVKMYGKSRSGPV